MKYVVTLRDGSTINCHDFDNCGVDGLVEIQMIKAWREHRFSIGPFKFGSVSKLTMEPVVYIPLADIKKIEPVV